MRQSISNNRPINIVFRVYNDRVLFRYEFPDRSDSPANIIDENMAYAFSSGTNRWIRSIRISRKIFPFSDNGTANVSTQQW